MSHREESLKAFIGIRRVSELFIKLVRNDAKKYNVNINEFAVLEMLLHKGPLTINEITERVLIANSSMTYIIDQLTNKNLVYRQTHSEDKRISVVHLTEEGRELITQAFPCHADLIEECFATLSEEEIINLRNSLKKITAHVNQM